MGSSGTPEMEASPIDERGVRSGGRLPGASGHGAGPSPPRDALRRHTARDAPRPRAIGMRSRQRFGEVRDIGHIAPSRVVHATERARACGRSGGLSPSLSQRANAPTVVHRMCGHGGKLASGRSGGPGHRLGCATGLQMDAPLGAAVLRSSRNDPTEDLKPCPGTLPSIDGGMFDGSVYCLRGSGPSPRQASLPAAGRSGRSPESCGRSQGPSALRERPRYRPSPSPTCCPRP